MSRPGRLAARVQQTVHPRAQADATALLSCTHPDHNRHSCDAPSQVALELLDCEKVTLFLVFERRRELR